MEKVVMFMANLAFALAISFIFLFISSDYFADIVVGIFIGE